CIYIPFYPTILLDELDQTLGIAVLNSFLLLPFQVYHIFMPSTKSNLSIEEITNMIKKILSDAEDNKHRKRRHGIFHNIPPAPPSPRRLDDDFGKEIKRVTRDLKKTI